MTYRTSNKYSLVDFGLFLSALLANDLGNCLQVPNKIDSAKLLCIGVWNLLFAFGLCSQKGPKKANIQFLVLEMPRRTRNSELEHKCKKVSN